MLHVEHELLDWQKALVKVKVVRAAGRAAVAHSPVQNRPLPPPPLPPIQVPYLQHRGGVYLVWRFSC